MVNALLILGQVVGFYDDKGARVVVVKTGERNGQGKTYEDKAACRFYGKAIEHANKASEGDWVKVDAKVTSRQSERGGWFSTIEARYLEVVTVTGAKTSPSRPGKPAPPRDDDDGSNLPF